MPRRRLPSRLALVVLVLLATSVTARASAATNATAAHVDTSSSRNASSTNTSATITVSLCELCRDRGQCDQAYHGSAGIFCSGSRQRLACCCPADGVCLRTDSANGCACGSRPSRAQDASVKDQRSDSTTKNGAHKILWTVTGAVVLAVLIAMYLYSTRSDRSYHYREPRCPARAGVTSTVSASRAAQDTTHVEP